MTGYLLSLAARGRGVGEAAPLVRPAPRLIPRVGQAPEEEPPVVLAADPREPDGNPPDTPVTQSLPAPQVLVAAIAPADAPRPQAQPPAVSPRPRQPVPPAATRRDSPADAGPRPGPAPPAPPAPRATPAPAPPVRARAVAPPAARGPSDAASTRPRRTAAAAPARVVARAVSSPRPPTPSSAPTATEQIEVRIGRVEVRAPQSAPPAATPPMRPGAPRTPPSPRGFGELAATRRHLDRIAR